jgi:hypothetical protein
MSDSLYSYVLNRDEYKEVVQPRDLRAPKGRVSIKIESIRQIAFDCYLLTFPVRVRLHLKDNEEKTWQTDVTPLQACWLMNEALIDTSALRKQLGYSFMPTFTSPAVTWNVSSLSPS